MSGMVRRYIPEPVQHMSVAEISTWYVGKDDRFIVSLTVGYKAEDMLPSVEGRPVKEQAKQAAASALALTTEDGASGDTLWSVFDRKSKQLFTFEQREFNELEVR